MILRAVGLLSPGDMGHIVGEVLIENEMPVLTCLKGRSERTRGLARKVGIAAVPTYEELVLESDMILSILVPAEAENAARTVVQALDSTGERIVYVDCNAISPMASRKIAAIIEDRGSKYVDASIIGPPPRTQGTTRFYTSGSEAKQFELLSKFGLDIRPIGSEIGQAKGIKMAYASLTKGLTAISTQLLIAAKKMGLFESLIEEFKKSQAELYSRMERSIPHMPYRSRRWIGEMEEISRTFQFLGMTPKIYQGAADMYKFIGSTELADETAETVDKKRTLSQVIDLLVERLES
jgi:3-hydroxyisobutyrate dehydrogenase-like beta-hydroxyacid dehydrogenase